LQVELANAIVLISSTYQQEDHKSRVKPPNKPNNNQTIKGNRPYFSKL